jgi:SPP1 family predicted phage head-tail adaptor
MRAGLLRHRITYLVKDVSRDAMGGEIVTWTEFDTDMADVTPLSGREYFQALQVNAEYEIRFRVRYRDDITEGARLVWRDKQYDILHVIDVDARKRTTEMLCRTAPTQ